MIGTSPGSCGRTRGQLPYICAGFLVLRSIHWSTVVSQQSFNVMSSFHSLAIYGSDGTNRAPFLERPSAPPRLLWWSMGQASAPIEEGSTAIIGWDNAWPRGVAHRRPPGSAALVSSLAPTPPTLRVRAVQAARRDGGTLAGPPPPAVAVS